MKHIFAYVCLFFGFSQILMETCMVTRAINLYDSLKTQTDAL